MANQDTGLLFFFVAAAIVGLAMVPFLAFSTNFTSPQVAFGQPLIGSLFSALCVMGIVASLYPVKCKGMFGKSQNPTVAREVKIVGHHPDCEKYSPNRIQFAGRNVCAACSGLLVGAVIALGAVGDYFFIGTPTGAGSVLSLLLCEAFMLVGAVQIFFKNYVKALANLFFVVGSSVALIEVDLLTHNLLLDFYMLGLIAFMLYLRISLSEWRNRRTCQNCHRCF